MLPWTAIVSIVGTLLSIIGTLIVYNLQCIKKGLALMSLRLDSQDRKIDDIEKSNLYFRQNIQQDFVDKEDWLREAGNNRQQLSVLTITLSRMEGKLDVADKLPAICGNIAREVVKEMKGVQQ
jgi:hypothetical protein